MYSNLLFQGLFFHDTNTFYFALGCFFSQTVSTEIWCLMFLGLPVLLSLKFASSLTGIMFNFLGALKAWVLSEIEELDSRWSPFLLNSRNPRWHNALSSPVKMRIPHSNAFIDLNKDFTAGESPNWVVFNYEKRRDVFLGFFFLTPKSPNPTIF